MTEQMFIDAGFSAQYFSNLKYIAHDEEQHVTLLESAITSLGAKPVDACTYSFPYTDPKSFVTLASVLEGVGTSAYLGGAGLIKSPEYLGVAASILVTEAIHTSLQRFTIGEVAPANPYGTALDLNAVYTLAAAFITSCPTTNAALPVKAFPTLTAVQGNPVSPGLSFSFSVGNGMVPANSFVTFINGLMTTAVPATMSGDVISAMVPMTAQGQTYAFITNADPGNGTIMDSMVLYGPAIIEVTPPAPTFDISIQ